MTVNPAKLYNFEAGYLAENGPADITIFDAKADRLVDSHFASKAANSPFIGETLKKGRLNIPSVRTNRLSKLDGFCSRNYKNRERICIQPINLKTSLSYFLDIFSYPNLSICQLFCLIC